MSSARKIGVLVGGFSLERDASIRAGEAIVATLRKAGHDVQALFVDRHVDMALRQSGIDLAFVAVRGRYGADGCLQGLLEMLAIPYTGSGVLASGLAMNRAKTKDVLRLHNLPTAPAYMIRAQQQDRISEVHGAFGFPVVVRPVGATLLFGGTLVRDEMELESALESAFALDDEALVERFLQGRPLSVPVLDGQALGVVQVSRNGSWTVGRSAGARGHEICTPARLPSAREASVLRLATQAYEALGCDGPACVEMVVSERFNEIIVDVDCAPLLLPGAPLPRMAQEAGFGFENLVEEILAGARLRAHGIRRNRRTDHRTFEGPDRRETAAPAAH
jgi:D-alanine-D-alanine ligase